MRKRTRVEDAYFSLQRLGNEPLSRESVGEIRGALVGSNSLLVSLAADIAGSRGLQELVVDMVSVFDGFMSKSLPDKQCKAKISIVNALNALGYMGDSVFLAGVKHVQMEPAFGGFVDTAAKLRSGCAYGLARIVHPDAHFLLAELLVDDEHDVRAAAAKALSYLADPKSELLLRLKVLTGDSGSEVISECFAGLMAMTPYRSLEFVSRFMESDDISIVEYAALAIGGSRLSEALDVLRRFWECNLSPEIRRSILLPVALVRSDGAVDFLAEVVRTADVQTAVQAISVLSMYTDDRSLNVVREAVGARGDAAVTEAFEREFGGGRKG